MTKRTLRLVKESLTPLDTDTLGSIVGGVSIPNPVCLRPTFQIECVNDLSFEICPTLPIEECL